MQQPSVTLKKHNIRRILLSCTPSLAESYQQLDDAEFNQDSADAVQLEELQLDEGCSKVQVLDVTGPLTGRTLQEDVSYIIIKTEGLDDFIERRKRRNNSATRSTTRLTQDGKPVNVNGPFECMQPSSFIPNGTCHQIFFNCCEYSLHYREEHTKRRKAALRCQVCEKHLDTELDFKQERNLHPCNICDKIFNDPEDLNEHCRTMHVKLRPFECKICRKRFTQHGGLQQHMRMHTGDRPFECKICQKRFTQHGGLQQHMRMHTGDRPFPCNYCEKRFTQKAGLDQHLRIHTKIKPFHCVVCWKNFSQSVHLKQHMRTHTLIQPFQCGFCTRRFKQSGHLNVHLKSHTPAQVRIHEVRMSQQGQPIMLDDSDVHRHQEIR